MKKLLARYLLLYDNLAMRERILVAVAALVVFFGLWYFLLWKSLLLTKSNYQKKLDMAKKELPLLQKQLETQTEQLQKIVKEYAKLEPKQKEKVAAKERPAGKLVSANETMLVLKELLLEKHKLYLQDLRNLPAKSITIGEEGQKAFEHTFVIKFRGDYFETLRYLQALEIMKWPLFWDSLDYKVTKYPVADVTLRLYTLSDQEDFIHV